MPISLSTLETIKNARSKYSRGNNKVVKLAEGNTRLRIVGNQDIFWRDNGVHWIKDQDDKVVAAVGCNEVVHEQDCSCCSALAGAVKVVAETGDEELKKYVVAMKARKVVLVPAVILDGKDKNENAVQILELTATTFDKVLSTAQDFAAEDINIFGLEDGIDLIIERSGKGLDTEYTVKQAPKSMKLNAKVLADTFPDIDGYIEKEFFAPDKERKAVSFLTDTFGLKALPARGAVRRLAPIEPSPAVSTDIEDVDYSISEPEPTKPALTKPALKVAPKPVETPAPAPAPETSIDEDDIDALLGDLDLDG